MVKKEKLGAFNLSSKQAIVFIQNLITSLYFHWTYCYDYFLTILNDIDIIYGYDNTVSLRSLYE